MSIVITIIAAINLIVIFFFGKTLRNPLIYLIFWWYFWLCISTLSITGLNTPSVEVYAIYILMLISATFGALLFYFRINKIKGRILPSKFTPRLEKDLGAYNLLLKIINYIAAPVVTFFFLKSLYVITTVDNINLYRDIVFATGEVDSAVFGSGTTQFVYSLTISSLIIIGVFVGAAAYIVAGRKKLFITSVILFCMDAVMMLGRFNFYIIIVTSIIILLMSGNKAIKDNKLIKKLLVLVVIPMVLIGFQRGDDDIGNQFKTYALEYHTLGFSIFDTDYNNKQSILNADSSNGFSSFGAVEQLVFVIIRRVDDTYKASSILAGDDLNNKRLIGKENQIYNAYGTVIYSLYFDSGLPYIVLFPLLWGYALMRSAYLAKRDNSIYQYSLTIVLSYICFFGIFQSLLLGSFWLYILFLITLFRGRLIKLKMTTLQTHAEKI